MKFKNVFSYVQRQIDIILRFYKAFVKVYVNNIIIFNKSFKEHIQHFHIVFDLLNKKNVILSLKFFF